MTRPAVSDKLQGLKERSYMAFIICDDHNLDVEADGIDGVVAKQLMLTDSKPDANPAEKEVIEFGKIHRRCNIRILAG
jgi:hypothetical protein